jgi:hypothetical protein
MNCAHCGAVVDLTALACAYCRAPTPAAARARAEESASRERALAQHAELERSQRAASSAKMDAAAGKSFVLALVGLVVCFIPILQIISIVFYFRARATARQLSVHVPWKATVGGVLSTISLLSTTVFLTWAFIRDGNLRDRADARIAALTPQANEGALRPTLDYRTACALAEIHALKDGSYGQDGWNLVDFDCKGKLDVKDETATLAAFSFKVETNDVRHDVTVCFSRGSKWYVTELSPTHTCRASSAVPPANAPKH